MVEQARPVPSAGPSGSAEAAPSANPSGPAACPTQAQWLSARPSAPPTTIGGTPANTPEAQALSQAVGAQGRAAFADVWGSQITDYPAGRVALCVTDLSRGQALAAAAKKADPTIDLNRLDFYRCRYSQRTLDAARDRVAALGPTVLGFPLYTFSPATDASGVQVTTTAEGAASKALHDKLAQAAGNGIPVTVDQGEAPVAS
ncbi:hypothetical protein C7C46_26530 [Streptomyces tateyamensis]|uniref:Uncharacterized protein n=1 Tax=Streptomyces tateyamensis TaxID=565073 RepID=A0A2V4NK85_9ACTN|nr:hypothetical protein [Streptomyces tateyamensis]PYC71907.1 hypothetical protein C7C46_26530 [Streptomyces tateyamensis]